MCLSIPPPIYPSSDLYHHGIKGQKWGVRRYQNEDGTLTEEGKKRYERYKLLYGKRGAEKIVKRINNGDSPRAAEAKTALRNAGLFVGGAAAVSLGAAFVASTPGLSDSLVKNMQSLERNVKKSVRSMGKSVVNKYYNASILDATGNVVKKYHNSMRGVSSIIDIAKV